MVRAIRSGESLTQNIHHELAVLINGRHPEYQQCAKHQLRLSSASILHPELGVRLNFFQLHTIYLCYVYATILQCIRALFIKYSTYTTYAIDTQHQTLTHKRMRSIFVMCLRVGTVDGPSVLMGRGIPGMGMLCANNAPHAEHVELKWSSAHSTHIDGSTQWL